MGGDTATTTVAGHLQREVTKPRSAVRGEVTSIGPDDTFLPFRAFNRLAPEAPGQRARERQHPGGSQRTLSGTCLASVLAMGPFLQRVPAESTQKADREALFSSPPAHSQTLLPESS